MTPAPNPGKWTDLKVRTMSSVLLIPAVLIDIWYGGVWFTVLSIFLGVMVAYEWSNIANDDDAAHFALLALTALIAGLMPQSSGVLVTLAVVAALFLMTYFIADWRKAPQTFWAKFGAIYVGLPVMALVMLRNDEQWGAEAIIWVMIIVWSADIMAYFFGRTFGGPKLAPILSPNKTWSGLVGAVVGAATASLLFALWVEPGRIWPLIVLAGVFAIIEQGGDIFESTLKRRHNVKDSGDLIPGHGGIIDRVDGLLAVAVAAWVVGALRNSSSAASGLLNW
jgi:phosphatidate cytidylyltransferase